MDICQRVTRVVSPRRLGGGLVGPHLRGGRYPGDSSVPLCHVVLAGRFGDSPLPNPFLRWVGRAASPRRPLFPMGAQFCLPCRSRRAARRSAPTESVLCDGLVGPHLRGGRYPDGSSVLPAMSFSAGGSEIRPYRIHFAR